ncbi:hypothetical protein RAA17_24295 [Komagataeibacter rhaeticus]|nr:hypothetical protein [Komagataeibacter rhaeticus]
MAKAAAAPAPHAPEVVPSVPVVPVQTNTAFRAAMPRDPQLQKDAIAAYRHAIMDLAGRLDGRLPVTNVLYEKMETGREQTKTGGFPFNNFGGDSKFPDFSLPRSCSCRTGIYAHTVSATNSDLGEKSSWKLIQVHSLATG